MALPKRITYFPGMISLVMLPVLINNYAWKYVKHYKQHAIEVLAERSICDDSPGRHLCLPGTDILIHGAVIRPYATMFDVPKIPNPDSPKKDIYIDESFSLRYAGEMLVVVGICFIMLAGFGVRRIYSYQK